MGLKKVFVVDDDEMLRTLVKDFLNGNPAYQVSLSNKLCQV
jgi:chemotaxis response regulator CheB